MTTTGLAQNYLAFPLHFLAGKGNLLLLLLPHQFLLDKSNISVSYLQKKHTHPHVFVVQRKCPSNAIKVIWKICQHRQDFCRYVSAGITKLNLQSNNDWNIYGPQILYLYLIAFRYDLHICSIISIEWYNIKCSDRSIRSETWNYVRPTDQSTNGQNG